MVKKVVVFIGLILLSAGCKPLHKSSFIVCGTYLNVTSPDKRAGTIVYSEFKRLEKIFNVYDQASEISRLNNSIHVPTKVSPELINILKIAKDLNDLSVGAFDVSHGALFKLWKDMIKAGDIRSLPTDEDIQKMKALGGMENIVIDSSNSTVTINKKGMSIDLGGIADGYMVDSAVGKLKENKIDSALIDVGGDIYCLGTNRGEPWRVGVRDPGVVADILEQELLVDEAVTTSGNYEQFFDFNGKRYSHLIDPRTGYPVQNSVVSVTVVTKNCVSADGLATAFFVLGEEGVARFIAMRPSTMRIFMVVENGGNRKIRIFR